MSHPSPSQTQLRIGTRGSDLALKQTTWVIEALRKQAPDTEFVVERISSIGDQQADAPLESLGIGVFTKTIETALIDGKVDVAVHSLKDVPSVLEEDFAIAAVLPRAAVRDVLVTTEEGGLGGLRKGATVATSSVRRRRLLESLRPDLQVVDIRGNVPTRIRKLHESGEIDGLLLAQAGLARLGFQYSPRSAHSTEKK